MKKLLTILILIFALHSLSIGQSFLKTYNYPTNPNAPVSFECITPTAVGGFFYIGGHIGDSIALFKVNQSGTTTNTRIIPNAGSGTELDGIIYDNNNDIVVIGNYKVGQGFVFKFSTVPNTVAWFTKTNVNDQIIFHDIVLIPNSKDYRIGATGLGALSGINKALIVNVIGGSGTLSLFSNFIVNGVEDATAIQTTSTQVYSTGRYSIGSGQSTWRPGLTRLNSTTAAHLGSRYYLVNVNKNARLYTTDMLMSAKSGVICGWGDDDGQNLFENLNLIKVKTNGALIWSMKYDDISASNDGTFSTIRYNNGVQNYAVLGYTYSTNTSSLDEAFIVYLDSSGNVLWSNRYPFFRHPGVFGENHQFVMSINNNFIFAIGEKDNGLGITEGVLLKVSAANGMLIDNAGLPCSDSIHFRVTPYTVNKPVTPTFLTPQILYTPLNVTPKAIKMSEQQVCGNVCNINGVVDVSVPEICRGDSVTLYALGNSGVAPYTYLWSPSGSVVCPTCSTTVAHPTVTTNYQVTITDALGCSTVKNILVTVDTNCCVSCTLSTTIHHTPKFVFIDTLNCGDTTLVSCNNSYVITPALNCNGDSSSNIKNVLLYDQNGNIPSWASSFLFNFGNGTLSIPNNTTGFYTLKYFWGVGNHICDSCSYTLKIQCCGNFTVNAGPDIVKCTATVQLGVTVTNGAPPFIYSWSPTSGLNNPNIANPTCSTTGTYIVTVTDAVGCVKTDTVKIIPGGLGCQPIVQNMQQNKLKASSNKLQIVPNPFTNSFTIEGLGNNALSLDILTADGKLIHRYNNISADQNFGTQLPTGVYLIKIFYKDGSSEILKTIKQ